MSDNITREPAASNAAETLYAQVFAGSPIPAVITRRGDHTVLAANERAVELVATSAEQAVGTNVTQYCADPNEWLELAAGLQRDGRADNVRIRIKRPAAEPLWALASSRSLIWLGEPAVLTVLQDIGEQVAAETLLRATERRLAMQSDALTSLTARYTNAVERFDDRLRSILQISRHALDVDRLGMWRFEDDHSRIVCAALHRRDSEEPEAGATLLRSDAPAYFATIERERVLVAHDAQADGRTREFLGTYLRPNGIGAMLDVPLRDDNGIFGVLCAEHVGGARLWTVDEQNFAVAVGNLIAVTLADEERRRALVQLAESEARARLVIDTAHDAFIGIDSEGMIVAWNAQAEATFGWTRDEAIGRNLAQTIVPPEFRDAHNEGLRRFHDTGAAPVVNQRLELRALDRSGREFPVELTITSPMIASGGYLFGAFLRDISDRRQRDLELRRAKESAEAATKAKSEFLANMSHELRTPLNGVLGYAQLLQREHGLKDNQREALEAIARCGSQLLDLINDVLDLSKIEAGRLDIEVAPVDLTRLVTDVRYVVAEAAERKGLGLTVSVDDTLPAVIVLDGRHLRQVLLNLLGNAIKFTTAGEVRLSVTRTADQRLHFAVSDTGPGIRPEALTEIFAAFSQTEEGAAAGGTGLGLAISDHLIAGMGGALRVDSVVGEGSRFWFTLPLIEEQGEARPAPADHDLAMPPLDARLAPGQHLTALVVDDSTANRHILASLLESAGLTVLTASGGFQAIEIARAQHPHVVFMDLKMSDLDGLEATRRLSLDPLTAAIPVIAVTASALGDVRQTVSDAGCVDYLSKPIRAQLLFGMLQRHLGARFISGQGEPPSAQSQQAAHEVAERGTVGRRLREAIAIGDIGELHEVAQQLTGGGPAEAALAARIHRLTVAFDFAGLTELADTLGE